MYSHTTCTICLHSYHLHCTCIIFVMHILLDQLLAAAGVYNYKFLLYEIIVLMDIPYRTKVWWEKSLAKMCKISIWRIKFGENVTILTIVIEWKDVWRIKFGDLVKFAKFTKLFSHQTFVLYGITMSSFILSCFSVLIVYLVVLIEYFMITEDLLQNITCMHTLT